MPGSAPLRASQLAKNARARVVAHLTGEAEAERLSALGLGLGARFRVLSAGSSLTLRVGGSRFALGKEWARALGVVEL